MPQPKKAARFGGTPSHHNMILANLATELFRHGRIRTTHAKAKTVQPVAERMVSLAKRGDVHSRRQVLQVIRDKDVVHKLFADVGPAFSERNGGYTRVLKLGPRKGDAAPMALIELVEGISVDGEGTLEEAPRRRWSLRRSRGSQSQTARDRSEERAAALDRGEDPDVTVDQQAAGADEAEAAPERAPRDEDPDDGEGPDVDPAEVEARLAAEDEAETAQVDEANEDVTVAGEDPEGSSPLPAEEQDAPAPERPGEEGPTTPTTDEPGDEDEERS